MKNTLKLIARELRAERAELRIERKSARLLREWVKQKGYCKDAGMEEAAEDIGMSVLQLKYYASRNIGVPFLTWRKELRIREAKRLMRQNPSLSQKEVAELVGINDVRNFRRQFEECAGVSLSGWCRKLRNRIFFTKFVGF